MDFIIRDCMLSDVAAIWQLNCEEMGYEFPLEQTEAKLRQLLMRDTDKIYVAAVGDEVVGYIHANNYDLLYAPHMKNIMGIAVSSQYRKLGIGKALLQSVEAWARKAEAAAVRLVSGAERAGAHAFYERCGYTGGKTQINFKKSL